MLSIYWLLGFPWYHFPSTLPLIHCHLVYLFVFCAGRLGRLQEELDRLASSHRWAKTSVLAAVGFDSPLMGIWKYVLSFLAVLHEVRPHYCVIYANQTDTEVYRQTIHFYANSEVRISVCSVVWWHTSRHWRSSPISSSLCSSYVRSCPTLDLFWWHGIFLYASHMSFMKCS